VAKNHLFIVGSSNPTDRGQMSLNKKVFVGVDIGTGSTKVIGLDLKGNVIAKATEKYPLYSKTEGWAEQDPEEIFAAVILALAKVVEEIKNQGNRFIETVVFSGAMHSLLAVDETGHPLTPSITWMDQRSAKEAKQLKANKQGVGIYQRTGAPIHPMLPLTKLLWFKKNNPEIFNAAHKWISIKEYIFYRLFGKFVVDYSMAGATGLFNMKKLDWDDEILKLLEISREKLSTPVPTTEAISGLNSEIADKIGIPNKVPFLIGASDGVLATLGAGAVKENAITCSIGTSGAVRTMVSKPITDPEGRFFCYMLTENRWVVGGAINNGGMALRWVGENLFDDLRLRQPDLFKALTNRARNVPVGTNGLLFLPYLTGERAPYWDIDMKGVFWGLTINHDRNDMIRAVLEGVIYQMNMVLDALKETGIEPCEIRATGGFTRSSLWLQMMADIFNEEILVPSNTNSACLGAVLLGMKAFGLIDDFISSANEKIKINARQRPIPENVEIYRRYKLIFNQLANNLNVNFSTFSETNQKCDNSL
jgi:gluconokinase